MESTAGKNVIENRKRTRSTQKGKAKRLNGDGCDQCKQGLFRFLPIRQ